MSFRVTLQPSDRAFYVPDGCEILTAGLKAGLNLPYSCRTGTCRSCRARVVRGSVAYENANAVNLDETERNEGFALLCRARALSDLVIEVSELSLEGVQPKIMPARVKRIERPAQGVVVLGLRLPMNANFRFAAGQFLDIQLPDGKTRSYSIANPPSIDGAVDIELHIRQLAGGRFSQAVLSSMKEGDLLRLRAPMGTFYLRENSEKPIILVASGTGYAPMQSIILYAQSQGLRRPMKLYWGNRTPSDFYTQPPAGLDYTPVVSDAAWEGRSGFVHKAVLEDHPDLSSFQVYACGAPAMVDAARRDFVTLAGLPEDEFFADSFVTKDDT